MKKKRKAVKLVKPVKKRRPGRKCEACDGVGTHDMGIWTCRQCNGTGRIRD